MTKHQHNRVGAMPIGFPAALHQYAGRRWLVDGAATFLADARTAMAGRVASMMPKPGVWVPNQVKAGFVRIGDVRSDAGAEFDILLDAAHRREGTPCSVVGDSEAVLHDADENGLPDPNELVDKVALWFVVDDDGATIGHVDGNRFSTLTQGDRLHFRFGDVGDGRRVLVGYWDRTDEPAVILMGVHVADPDHDDHEEIEVDLDVPLNDDATVTRREAMSVVSDLAQAFLGDDTDELERVFDRAEMLDPEGRDLPWAIVVGLCGLIKANLPADLQPVALELEVTDDETGEPAAGTGTATEMALRVFTHYHNGDIMAAAEEFARSEVELHRRNPDGPGVIPALLVMFSEVYTAAHPAEGGEQ